LMFNNPYYHCKNSGEEAISPGYIISSAPAFLAIFY
jgi:hypothetical protein